MYFLGFPVDTPNPPQGADLQMVVTRHEVAHQFDRIMYNRNSDGDTKLYDMFISLKEASKGSDFNWLRSQVGDDFFQRAPQEIIASHIGNQYLHSTTAQLRLAATRLKKLGLGLPMSWFLFNVELMTPAGSSVVKFYENEVNGKATSYDVSLRRDDQERINLLQIPNCGTIDITYGQDGIVHSISENAGTCFIPP